MKFATQILPTVRTVPHDPETALQLIAALQDAVQKPETRRRPLVDLSRSANTSEPLGKLRRLWRTPIEKNVGAAIAIGLPLGQDIRIQPVQTAKFLSLDDETTNSSGQATVVRRTGNAAYDILALLKARHQPGDRYLDPTPAAPWTATRPYAAGNYQAMFGAAQLLYTPYIRLDPRITARTSYELTRLCALGEIDTPMALTIDGEDVVAEMTDPATLTFLKA